MDNPVLPLPEDLPPEAASGLSLPSENVPDPVARVHHATLEMLRVQLVSQAGGRRQRGGEGGPAGGQVVVLPSLTGVGIWTCLVWLSAGGADASGVGGELAVEAAGQGRLLRPRRAQVTARRLPHLEG